MSKSRQPDTLAPGNCTCGRQAAGYDAVLKAPACPVCAYSRGDRDE